MFDYYLNHWLHLISPIGMFNFIIYPKLLCYYWKIVKICSWWSIASMNCIHHYLTLNYIGCWFDQMFKFWKKLYYRDWSTFTLLHSPSVFTLILSLSHSYSYSFSVSVSLLHLLILILLLSLSLSLSYSYSHSFSVFLLTTYNVTFS